MKLSALLANDREGPEIERTVARAVGLSDEAVPPEELTWGVQRFLEVLADDRPVVLVLDDIQWAEPTFLDMIEHISDWARDAAILVVCRLGRSCSRLAPVGVAASSTRARCSSLRCQPTPPRN